MIMAKSAKNVRVNAALSSLKASCFPFSSSSSERTGIRAEVRAPSPKSRRNRFGIVKAMMKASAYALTPKTA